MFTCDEESLKWVAETLGQPLPDLLRESLPVSMVLILACYACHEEGDGGGDGGHKKAQAKSSNDLLIRYLTQEVRSVRKKGKDGEGK